MLHRERRRHRTALIRKPRQEHDEAVRAARKNVSGPPRGLLTSSTHLAPGHRELLREDVSKTSQDHCKRGMVPSELCRDPQICVAWSCQSLQEWSQRKTRKHRRGRGLLSSHKQSLGHWQSRKRCETSMECASSCTWRTAGVVELDNVTNRTLRQMKKAITSMQKLWRSR